MSAALPPELERFFQTMDRAFAEPASLPEVHAAAQPWPAALERVAIYTRFVEGHIRSTLQKVFPLTVAVLGDRFAALAAEYYRTRPARHFEMNRAAEGFVSFLADRAGALALPPHTVALARFEWTDFAVYASEVELPASVDTLTPNPTLAVLQHPFGLCAFVAARPELRPASPAMEEETALLWRDRANLRTSFVAADARRLLALKLVIDGTPLTQASAETGAPVSLLEDALVSAVNEGFVLAPTQR